LHDKVLINLADSLVQGGLLVIGVKEQPGVLSNKYFKIHIESENIYRRV